MKTPDQITIDALHVTIAKQTKVIETLSEHRSVLMSNDKGVGGVYRKTRFPHVQSELLAAPIDGQFENIYIEWSDIARVKFRLSNAYHVDLRVMQNLPQKVNAEGWWHLCAQVGVIEPMARLLYHHPENEQPSATKKAKPVSRGVVISCQGDYID